MKNYLCIKAQFLYRDLYLYFNNKRLMMKRIFVTLLCLSFMGISVFAGDNSKKNSAPPVTMPKPAPKKEVVELSNITTSTNIYTYQETPNEINLINGMKIQFALSKRFPIPPGVGVVIPDTSSERKNYELLEVAVTATNTSADVVKLDDIDLLFSNFKLYSNETANKIYSYQYKLSFGSIYNSTQPTQPALMSKYFSETSALMKANYKPNESRTAKGIIACVSKAAKKIDYIVIQVREFGLNKYYGCPIQF